jgi:hypothetical protein
MQITQEIEGLFETLYRDFLSLRLGPAWNEVVGMLYRWAEGDELDADAYRALRQPRSRTSKTDPRKKKR